MGDGQGQKVKVLECDEHHKHRFVLGHDYPASALAGFIAGVVAAMILVGFAFYFLSISNIG